MPPENDPKHDPESAPNRRVAMPTTAPIPSPAAHAAELKAAQAAEEAKWQKTLADHAAAAAKAEAEGKEPPKSPARPASPASSWPAPAASQDQDLAHLRELLGDAVEDCFEQAGETVCQVKKESILEALTHCHQDVSLRYEMLSDMTATHYPAGTGFAFSVVYHLTCVRRRRRLRLRALIPEGFEPESATRVYPGANWLEREIYDMLGIRFANHPDMTRILCPDGWEGHPLLKDYPVVGLGQREMDYREDRSGRLRRAAMESAGNTEINRKPVKAY